jgi:hypothetical protein
MPTSFALRWRKPRDIITICPAICAATPDRENGNGSPASPWLLEASGSRLSYVLLKERWAEQKTVQIPAAALEVFAANPEGVGIGRRMVSELHLNQEQVLNVNRVLRRYQREFMVLERRFTERSTNPAGHVVVTVKPFPQEMDDLMNRMWTSLGIVLNADQFATAKSLDFAKFFPSAGRKQMTVEIWQGEDGEFHYVENQEPAGKNSGGEGFLPQRYRNWLFHDSQKTNN